MSRSYPLFRPAKVMSQDDPEKRGRLQLQVLPELSTVTADLPWADPFSYGTAGKSFHLPPKDSTIWCVIWNKYWTDISYLSEQVAAPTTPPFQDFLDNVAGEIDTLSSPAYPGLNLDTEEDGFVTFHDIKGQQHGVYHPSGVFVMIAKNGDVTVRAITKVTIGDKDAKNSMEVDLSGGTFAVTSANEFSVETKEVTFTADKTTMSDAVEIAGASDNAVIFKPLEEILKELLKHVHAAPGGPTGPPLKSSMSPLASLQPNLTKMKAKKLKTE